MIFQNKKTPFQPIKTRSSKSRKIDIFRKGLTHGYGAKMAIFPTFSFQLVQARKMSFWILQNKKTPFQPMKTRSSKSRNINIFPWFWSKNVHFSNISFLANIGLENVFSNILERKNAFQAIKTTSSKSQKIDIFPKGLTYGLGQKMASFAPFFIGNIFQENVFCDILERKYVFLGY